MRPVEGIAHAAATLAGLRDQKRPAWVSERAWGLARDLVEALRADIEAHVEATWATDGETAAALGVGRTTLYRWRLDGWLSRP